MSSGSLLVEPEALRERLEDPSLVVVDASVTLTRPDGVGPYRIESGRAGYEREHIPGAVFADLLTELSDPEGSLPFALPAPTAFAAAASRLGIGRGKQVVVYTQALPTFAARLWWLLRYHGFDAVAVLNGGLEAWRRSGSPVTSDPTPAPPPGDFDVAVRPELLADRRDVEASALGEGTACLVHSLSEAEYRGDGEPEDARVGHIPRSVNVPWYRLVDDEQRYRSAEELEALFDVADLDDREVITYCGGGIAASMDAFALALTGRTDVKVYDGSLAEWSADMALPLERG